VEDVRLIPAQFLSDFAGDGMIEEFQFHQALLLPFPQGLTQDLFLFFGIQFWQLEVIVPLDTVSIGIISEVSNACSFILNFLEIA
jgi:hypothetical protein